MPNLIQLYGGRVVIRLEVTNWMNLLLTEDYYSNVCLFGIVSNVISADAKAAMKGMKVQAAVILGGWTGFLQAPGVC